MKTRLLHSLALVAVCAVAATAQPTTTQNHVVTNSILTPGITTEQAADALTALERRQQVVYLDGLGRTVQTVQTQASPQLNDVVVPATYDPQGRPDKSYLPYVRDNTGGFQADGLAQQLSFYQTGWDRVANDSKPYAVSQYEASPLSRVTQKGAPGLAWQPDTPPSPAGTPVRTIKLVPRTNTFEEVRSFVYDYDTRRIGSVAVAAGRQAVIFDGIDDHVLMAGTANTALNCTGRYNLTMEAWICPTSSSSEGIIISMGELYRLGLEPNGEIKCGLAMAPQGFGTWRNTGMMAPLNTWTHVAITVSPTTVSPGSTPGYTVQAYINGTGGQIISGGYGSLPLSNQVNNWFDFRIGGQQVPQTTANASSFTGMIADVRIWSTTRTAAEISASKDLDVTGQSGLLAYWKMNELTGILITDSGPNRYTGRFQNGPTRSAATLPVTPFYQPNELIVSETRDEHDVSTLEYVDKFGNTVLRKVATGSTATPFASTYYAYDAMGNLRVVLPPKAAAALPATGEWNLAEPTYTEFINTWAFTSDYDDRRRIIARKTPGAGLTRYIYNERNQVVLTQTANQASTNQWVFTKYDALARPIMTGFLVSTFTYDQLVAAATSAPATWESVVSSTTAAGKLTYTLTNSFPTNVTEDDLLTRMFYDTYNYEQLSGKDFAQVVKTAGTDGYDFSITADNRSLNTTGLLTATQTRVMGEAIDPYAPPLDYKPWLTSIRFYDEKGQTIQSLVEHYRDGQARTTLQLSFMGQVEKSVLEHAARTTTAVTPPYEQHTIYQKQERDHTDRVTRILQKVDNQPLITIVKNEYNAIGQLVDKKLHSTDNADAFFLQSVDYRYNIRGWLTNINNRNISSNTEWLDNSDPNSDNLGGGDADAYDTNSPVVNRDVFGLELKYDEAPAIGSTHPDYKPQYNGNITAALWRTYNPSKPQNYVLRGYAYAYDKMNRLIDAQYGTYEGGGTWGIYTTDYSTSNIAYDLNGNITQLDRMGDNGVGAPPVLIDQLRYSYLGKGNQLTKVEDWAGSTPATTHDFEDAAPNTTGSDEYEYDLNGNLTSDINKSITAITYNYLNLPELITFTAGRTIRFVYTADGNKLAKYASRPGRKGMVITNSTTYLSGFVYNDNRLAFAPMPEGRMVYTPTPDPVPTQPFYNWKHEYHLKDHLGNLRYAFRDEGGNTLQRSTSMEPASADTEENQFEHLAETRQRDAVYARTGEYVARLNAQEGRRQGPSVRLAVSAGDSIRTEVYARYDHRGGAIIRAGALAVGTAVGSTALLLGPGDDKGGTSTTKRWLPFIGFGVAAVPQLLWPHKHEALPGAMLRLELFDKDSQMVRVQTQPIRRTATDEWQQIQTGLVADSSGYVVVSLVNETGVTAYFDDLALRIVDPQEVQENHYDPWGLNLVGIEDEGNPNSQFQFNGKEKQADFGLNLLDYGARMYDPQLGRWNAVDPMAEKMRRWSPYVFCFDNPIRFVDFDGMQAKDDFFTSKGTFLKHTNTKTNNIYVDKGGKNVLLSQLNTKDKGERQTAANVVGYYGRKLGMDKVGVANRYAQSASENPAVTESENNRVYINTNGGINSELNDSNNLTNVLVHEKQHQDDNTAGGSPVLGILRHAQIYLVQSQHPSFGKGSSSWQVGQAGAFGQYIMNAIVDSPDGANKEVMKLLTQFNQTNTAGITITGDFTTTDGTGNSVTISTPTQGFAPLQYKKLNE